MSEANNVLGLDRLEERDSLDLGHRIIIFVGPEGSGKSTIAEKLALLSDKPLIGTGDILRHMAENDVTELGDAVRQMFAEHGYLEAAFLLQVLEREFAREDLTDGFILDGGLRTVEETAGFPTMLEKVGKHLPVTVIHLLVPEQTGIERLMGPTGRNRPDDTLEGIHNRLTRYNDQLEERLAQIQRSPNWKLVPIDATPGIEEVFERVVEALIS